jgi:hypothetical protein
MKTPPILVIATLPMLASCQQQPTVSSEAKAATPPTNGPIVVELYQSQGCSSCPPANQALNMAATRPDIIALNFSVTYWDRLGWKDIFGDPAYTERQRRYANALTLDSVFTPQMILNGRTSIVGNGKGELDRVIRSMRPITGGPTLSVDANTVKVGGGDGKADIWLVRFDPRVQNVKIGAGENSGRTLPHRNIVRQLVKLGTWQGKAASYRLPALPNANYRSAILLQRPDHREIIAAKKI